jgi:hypothetical protein
MNNFLILTAFISLKFWVSFQPSKMRSNSFEFNEEKCLEIDLSFKEFKKKLQICAILLIFSLFRLIVHIYIHIKIIFFFSIWLEFWKNVWNDQKKFLFIFLLNYNIFVLYCEYYIILYVQNMMFDSNPLCKSSQNMNCKKCVVVKHYY